MNTQPEYTVKKYLVEILLKILPDNIDESDLWPNFSMPPNITLGEYAFACFTLAKKLQKSPQEIAQDIVEAIESDEIIESVTVAGPYVNFKLQTKYYNKLVLESGLFIQHESQNKKIMLEYSGPNPCKTFHVGHFRNTILGSAMINLYRYSGIDVMPVNYLNDTGTHVAKVIWLYLKKYKDQEPEQLRGRWLGELYVEANNLLADDKDLMEEVYVIHRKLEAKDFEATVLLEKFKEWSNIEFDTIYKQLDAEFDHVFYDSEYILDGKDVVKELEEKGIAQKSEGAMIVDLEEYGLHVALVLKSDGSAVYITKDLAMAQDRFKKYDVDGLVYVVGAEQILHFKQIFKILELNGFEQAKNCFHLAYELVNTASGKKMSTREGTVVLYHEIYEQAYDMALQETQQRHGDWSEQQVLETAERIALCALKFDMLKQDAQKKINFDLAKALDVSGDTGPYIMYTMARLRSIITKSGVQEFNIENYDVSCLSSENERELIKKLSLFDGVLSQAAGQNKPSLVAHYFLELARLTNQYYHATTILDDNNSEVMNARIILLHKVVQIMEHGFEILNIRWVNEM